MKNLITCLVVCVLSGVTFADTWTVDDDGLDFPKADFDNIQAAVDEATDGDEIIVFPGTYTSTADQVVNMLGKKVWLHGSGGAEVTIIDGEDARRGIACWSDEELDTVIEGFTITNGYMHSGGGMYCSSSPKLIDCAFTYNTASFQGGGMLTNNSIGVTLENCTFKNNTAGEYGGGMRNLGGNPILIDCVFEENTATNKGGGGMYNNSSDPTLTNCTFTGNTTYILNGGGGMRNEGSSPTITNCTFTNNSSGYGGGMYNYSGSSSTLTDCTFENNGRTNLWRWDI